jgi:hypothetical protein
MTEPTYPIAYVSEPSVTLMKATKPLPAPKEPPARPFPLAGQSQLRPLADPTRKAPESQA